ISDVWQLIHPYIKFAVQDRNHRKHGFVNRAIIYTARDRNIVQTGGSRTERTKSTLKRDGYRVAAAVFLGPQSYVGLVDYNRAAAQYYKKLTSPIPRIESFLTMHHDPPVDKIVCTGTKKSGQNLTCVDV